MGDLCPHSTGIETRNQPREAEPVVDCLETLPARWGASQTTAHSHPYLFFPIECSTEDLVRVIALGADDQLYRLSLCILDGAVFLPLDAVMRNVWDACRQVMPHHLLDEHVGQGLEIVREPLILACV